MLELYVVYREYILFLVITLEECQKVSWVPAVCINISLVALVFGEWPSWQHFTDGNRIQGTDPACLLSPISHSAVWSSHLNPDLILKATVCARAQDWCHPRMADCHLLCSYISHHTNRVNLNEMTQQNALTALLC